MPHVSGALASIFVFHLVYSMLYILIMLSQCFLISHECLVEPPYLDHSVQEPESPQVHVTAELRFHVMVYR